jgi:hypothetical protein
MYLLCIFFNLKKLDDKSRLYVLRIAIHLLSELEQANKETAESYLRACYAVFQQKVGFDK